VSQSQQKNQYLPPSHAYQEKSRARRENQGRPL
jgi:hypothetical protein